MFTEELLTAEVGEKSKSDAGNCQTRPSEQHLVFRNVDADKFYRIEEGRERAGLQSFGSRGVKR